MRNFFTRMSACLIASAVLTSTVFAVPPRIIINDTEAITGAFISDGTMYAPVRRVFEACGYTVGWNSANSAAVVTSGDKTILLPQWDGCRNINSTLYAPIRKIAEILDAQVTWDGGTSTVFLEIKGTVQLSVASVAMSLYTYTDDDLYWLARIIYAEAQGESMEGKIAVGNVILERVRCPDFPDTIYGVIFDRVWGVQFEPVKNGRIYCTPDESCYEAARRVLEGESAVINCLYFLNPVKAANRWIINNRNYVKTIGNHDFYA